MTPEQQMWEGLRPVFQSMQLHPVRVEQESLPDVNYVGGWVELKHLEQWPIRDIPVRIPKLEERKTQVAWMAKRWESQGLVFLLLRVGRELLLFDGWTVPTVKARRTRSQLRELSIWRTEPLGRLTQESVDLLRNILLGRADDLPANYKAKFYRLRARQTAEETADDMGVPVGYVLGCESGAAGHHIDDLLGHWED
jgi:hypothetical protein